MKTIRLILLFATLAGLTAFAHAADAVNVRGLLVVGSNQPGESDPRLAAYVANLRRILRVENFRLVGEDATSLPVPASGKLTLGGQGVQLSTESADGRTVLLRAHWGGARQDIVVQRGGGTTLLVGPGGRNGEVSAVILIAR